MPSITVHEPQSCDISKQSELRQRSVLFGAKLFSKPPTISEGKHVASRRFSRCY